MWVSRVLLDVNIISLLTKSPNFTIETLYRKIGLKCYNFNISDFESSHFIPPRAVLRLKLEVEPNKAFERKVSILFIFVSVWCWDS